MELNKILNRVVSILKEVDEGITRNDVPTNKKKNSYIPSIGSAKETIFVKKVMETWVKKYPSELPGIIVQKASKKCLNGCLEVPYEEGYWRGKKADIALTTNSYVGENDTEWIIEIKKFEAVGDAGGKHPGQEAAIAKLLSPWPMSSGLLYDVKKINSHHKGERKAVIMYGFSLDLSTIEHARNHPRNQEEMQPGRECNRAENLDGILKSNDYQPISFIELLDDFERSCESRGLQISKRYHSTFENLKVHPIYTKGDIVAWEVYPRRED